MVYQNYHEIITNNYIDNYYVGNIPNDGSSIGQNNLPDNYYIYKKPKNAKFIHILAMGGGTGGGGGAAITSSVGVATFARGGGGGGGGGLAQTIIPACFLPNIIYVRPGNGGMGGLGGDTSITVSSAGQRGQSGTQSLVTIFNWDYASVGYMKTILNSANILAVPYVYSGVSVGNESPVGGGGGSDSRTQTYCNVDTFLNSLSPNYNYQLSRLNLGLTRFVNQLSFSPMTGYFGTIPPTAGTRSGAGGFYAGGGGGGGGGASGLGGGTQLAVGALGSIRSNNSPFITNVSSSMLSPGIGENGSNSFHYGKNIFDFLKYPGSNLYLISTQGATGGGGNSGGNGGNGGHGGFGAGGGGGGGAIGSTGVKGGNGGNGGPGFIYIRAIL